MLAKKLIFLVNTIKKTINVSTPKARLCLRLVPRFDKKCKNTQMRIRKLKKIWIKKKTKES